MTTRKQDDLPWLSDRQRPRYRRLAALAAAPEEALAWWHEAGRLVLALRPDGRRYGGRWVPRLAAALGWSRDACYRALHFVRAYPTADGVRELEDLGLAWNHVVLLSRVRDARQRGRLQRRSARAGWSYEQLDRAIQERVGRGRIRGRRGCTLGNFGPAVDLRQLRLAAERCLGLGRGAGTGAVAALTGRLRALRAAGWKPGLARDLRDAAGALAELAGVAGPAATELLSLAGDVEEASGEAG